MLTITDYILLIVTAVSACNGWRRGFLRSLAGPLSLVVCSIFSFLYFQKTHNLLLSLLLGALGPFLLNIILSSFLGIWQKTANENKPISPSSRILGGFFNGSWNICILILFLILILLTPANLFGLTKVRNDISHSLTFSFLNQFMPDHRPLLDHFPNTARVFQDPLKLKAVESSQEYQDLMHDDKIQNILSDKNLIEQIRQGEVAKVLNNPKIQEVSQDQELIKKFFALEKNLLKESSAEK